MTWLFELAAVRRRRLPHVSSPPERRTRGPRTDPRGQHGRRRRCWMDRSAGQDRTVTDACVIAASRNPGVRSVGDRCHRSRSELDKSARCRRQFPQRSRHSTRSPAFNRQCILMSSRPTTCRCAASEAFNANRPILSNNADHSDLASCTNRGGQRTQPT